MKPTIEQTLKDDESDIRICELLSEKQEKELLEKIYEDTKEFCKKHSEIEYYEECECKQCNTCFHCGKELGKGKNDCPHCINE